MYKVFNNYPDIEYFFSTIENSNDEIDKTYYEIIVDDEYLGVNQNNEHVKFNAKKIFIKIDAKIKINGVVKKIQEKLTKINHCNTERMALIILYCYTFFPKEDRCVENINNVLNWISTADLNQYLIFETRNPTNFNLIFGEFRFGTLDFNKLLIKCENFKTDYAKLYRNDLENRLSIERKHFNIATLNLINILNYTNTNYDNINEALYMYYDEISIYYKADFEHEFTEQQNLMTFLNGDFFELNFWKLISRPTELSVFMNIPVLNGWIIPKGKGGINIDLANSDNRNNHLKEQLKTDYNFTNISNNNLHHAIESYLSFCAKAKRYKRDNLNNECFLHYIIALDLIFGEKNSSTNSVTTRASICTYRFFEKNYKENTKLIDLLYDVRSKYVHAGISVKIDNIILAENICTEIFYVFLRINKKTNDWNRDSWVKKLDLLVAHVNADEIPSEEKYEELGIK